MVEDGMESLRKRCDAVNLPDDAKFLGMSEPDEIMQLLVMEERVSQLRSMDSKTSFKHVYCQKPRVYFSGIAGSDSAMFERHEKLRAWSQWEKLLYVLSTTALIGIARVPYNILLLNTFADSCLKLQSLFPMTMWLEQN